MTSTVLIPLLLGLSAFLILALLSISVSSFLKRRKATNVIEKLLVKVKAEEETRKAEISKMLQENFHYPEENVADEANLFLHKENQFYQAIVTVYGDKLNSSLESFNIYVSALLEPYKQIKPPKSEEEKLGALQLEYDKLQESAYQAEQTAKEIFTEYMALHNKTDFELSEIAIADLLPQIEAEKSAQPPVEGAAAEQADQSEQEDPIDIERIKQERDKAQEDHTKALEVLNTVFLEFSKLANIDTGEKQEFTADEIVQLMPKEFDFKQVEGEQPPQG